MDQLQITLAQVTQTAASIRSQNQQLNSCLQEIGTSMNQLAAYWQSPASEKIRSRFHGMLPVFDNYRSIVESYAKFLDQTVSTYQSKASRILIQTMANGYLQQLYALQTQLRQQTVMLPSAAQGAELPLLQRQYRNVLHNVQEQIRICEGLRML